jgi:hypothetical protein
MPALFFPRVQHQSITSHWSASTSPKKGRNGNTKDKG